MLAVEATMDADSSCLPLDLSLNSARVSASPAPPLSPCRGDYCTDDSDDSECAQGDRRFPAGLKSCKAYKKSLMRRYPGKPSPRPVVTGRQVTVEDKGRRRREKNIEKERGSKSENKRLKKRRKKRDGKNKMFQEKN
ncbi:Protein of unknown function [Gryllus bimaculatus]|nr:Protein of unknown function [Gryllus bimaculatus]